MGIDSTGILFYGYCWKEDDEDDIHSIEDERHEEFRSAHDRFQCGVGLHCSFDYAMAYVYVEGTQTFAYRGSPKAIASFDIPADADVRLDAFCKELGIDTSEAEGPGWFLTSLFG